MEAPDPSRRKTTRVTRAGETGTLFLLGTPVGNLEDLSARAIRLLSEVDLVAAEDTRHTRKLLTHLGLHPRLVSHHQHSRPDRVSKLLEQLEAGAKVALVTDAGMPGVSDPGWTLVAAAVERGISVVPVPGACALVLALAGSGLPTGSFVFDGFLPRKPGPRRRRLETLAAAGMTIVVYESPHRVIATLQDVAQSLDDPPVAVGRELTKVHEEFLRGKASEVAQTLSERAGKDGRPLGEFTVVIGAGGEKGRDGKRPRPVGQGRSGRCSNDP